MPTATLSIIYGLASALVWGAGDFCGGLATRRANVYRVVLLAHGLGVFIMAGCALLFDERAPTQSDLFFGVTGGIAGLVGLLAFYQGLSQGSMGVTAPVAAIVTAVIPIIVGAIKEGAPPPLQLLGFAVALAAVWLLAGSTNLASARWREFRLPLLAGMGFGLFYVLFDNVSAGAVFWPLTGARIASVLILGLVVGRAPSKEFPTRAQWPIIGLAGLFDAFGNIFFVLAAQAGRLDIASVLSSLYPATTLLLARFLLDERLSPSQRWGAGLAIAALMMIAT
ncbi:MAG: DMT family transporter [Caldilineaceae bacterium]